MVNHKLLLHKLKSKFLFSNSACTLLESFLENRKQKVVCNGVFSNIENVYQGVPQGSILSPLLFSIFINDLSMVTSFIKLRFYADDIQTVCSCNSGDISSFFENVNKDLNSMFLWCINNGLVMNSSKTRVINFNFKIPSSNFADVFL